ncbi:MAG: YegS/Rv2252/BmrU family lipid kinase [Prevotella sp.]|nr:YegS/Rv2252/BmrU family lipid kinase [Prevotella sp.]
MIFFWIFIIFATVTKKKIVFIMNPISGTSSKAAIPKLIDETIDHERFDYEICTTEYAGHACEIATRAKNDGIDVVAAVGGDGTVNEVARSIVQSDTALAIVPCGSGNGLARHLMLPINVRKSIEIINRCEVHDLDYGIINGLPFFCTCGMGFDAFISMKFAMSGKRGPISYAENVLKEGLSYQPETYEIIDETGKKRHKAFLISCANASQYGNNAYIAPQASMSDGLLDVIIMEPFDLLDAPQISIDLFNKTLDKNSKIKTFKAKQIHVHREKPGCIHYDGDPTMADADVDISLVSKGIKIVVNPDADKSKRQPNMVQTAFSELFNDIHAVREDINRQSRNIQAINKKLLRRLNRM